MTKLPEKIIKGCKKQDTKAQMQFYNMYYKIVYNSCFRILSNAMDAEDAMQESFLKAFNKIDTWEDVPIEAWLKRIAINTSIDKLKKQKAILIELDERLPVIDEPYNEEEINWKEEEVKRAIFELTDNYRLILTLHLLEGLDYGEISELLNMKEGTVRVQFARARQKLLEQLRMKNICA